MAEAARAADTTTVDDSLTADYFPEAQPATEPTETATAEPVQQQVQQQTAPEQSAQPAPTAPAVPKFTIGGKEYTQDDIEAAFQTARQFPHLQQVHTDTKRALEALHQQQQYQIQQQQQASKALPQNMDQAKFAAAQVQAMYRPQIEAAIKADLIEADAAEAFPKLTSQLFHHVDRLSQLEQFIVQQHERISGFEKERMRTAVLGELDQRIASLAANGDAYAPLSDPGTRNQFLDFVRGLNLQIGQLSPENLDRLWIAHNKDNILGAASEAAKLRAAQTVAKQTAKVNARPDGVGTRPTALAPTGLNEMDDLISDLYPQWMPQR